METFLSRETMVLIWFGLLGVLLFGYAVLDGFDLGVGILHPFVAKNDQERRVTINSIGPLWDGNEVWLVTFGGALFAMFPLAYASVFSGFYNGFMLLLFALILRAVSLEFRSKQQSRVWRVLWDWCFFAGSSLAALLFGVAVGNIIQGIPLDAEGNFKIGLLEQLSPYPLLIGFLTIALFAMHGAFYLSLKATADLYNRIRAAAWRSAVVFAVLYLFATFATLIMHPQAVDNFDLLRWLWIIPVLQVLTIVYMLRCLWHGWLGRCFLASGLNMFCLVALLGAAIYPNLIFDPRDVRHSLSLLSAASSAKTLQIGLIIAAIGMPFVLAYSALIYWTFRGKVELDGHSY
jgi:cytochrome d ubiquinol oxidase subunit II